MSQHHKNTGFRKRGLSNRDNWWRRIKIKNELMKENGRKCGYCFKSVKNLTIDHIQPLSKGGRDIKENMMLSCAECNEIKADMTIDEWVKHLGWEDEL